MPSEPLLETRFLPVIAVLAIVVSGITGGVQQPAAGLAFGAGPDGIRELAEEGVNVTYVQLWAGAWLNRDGWKGFEDQLRHVKGLGHTPVVQLYYWGNNLTQECFTMGCDAPGGMRKDRAGWDRMVTELTPMLQEVYAGERVVVVLETEFNKQLRGSEELDEALANKSHELHQGYPNTTVVLGFGNWGQEDWHVFDRAAAAADEVGLQLMRGSQHDTPEGIRAAPDALLEAAQHAQRLFHKPIFVSDVALSSHGGAEYEAAQADALARLFELTPKLREAGVHAIVYRSLLDNPSADTSDHYREAERHFGVIWTHNQTAKPAFQALVQGLREHPPKPQEPAREADDDGILEWNPFGPAKKETPQDDGPQVSFVEEWFRGLLRN